MRAPDTADRILDAAERLVQTLGFNGFSYADISSELRITKASLHYHFATKAELGASLIARYQERFLAALEQIERDLSDAPARLAAYGALYGEVLRKKRMCLCGMLAADHSTLPRAMREGVTGFFDANEAWLARVLEAGRRARAVAFSGSARAQARLLLGSFEGAMLVARSYGDPERFAEAAGRMLAELTPR
jgi:TetR/AcrR family transcriptional repressor of nem operon